MDLAFQCIEGFAHGVVQGGAAAGAVVFSCKVFDLFDGDAVAAGFDALDAAAFEGDDGDVVVLVGEVGCVLSDAGEDFVDAGEGLVVDGGHGAAFVEDDYVVDVHGFCVLVSGGKSTAYPSRCEILESLSWKNEFSFRVVSSWQYSG